MNYELGIYKVVSLVETECVNLILEDVSFEKCNEKMNELKGSLNQNEYFDIATTDFSQSWTYSNDGKAIQSANFYEFFGLE